MDSIVPLIMAGGAGTRLWPASREARPKQFLPLFGPRSTFQDTLVRVADRALFGRPVVVTNAAYRFLVAEQMSAVGVEADVLLEPSRRDSGPAIAAGATFVQARGGDAIVLALAADHVVGDPPAFVAACRPAARAAADGRIVTFGVPPDRPATEYGYVRPGAPLDEGVFAVDSFVEKPDAQTAAGYIRDGYLWNSGNFMFRPPVLLDEYRSFDPRSVESAIEAAAASGSDGFVALNPDAFAATTAVSIDRAVMEKTSRAAVVPLACRWSEVGSWRAVWDLSDKDAHGNAARGEAVFEDARNCSVLSDRAVVALEGVDDLVVVATQDAVLVSRQKDSGGLRRLVAKLRTVAPDVTESHVEVHRPWGSYRSVDAGGRHQVKRIVVSPGRRLSLQKHYHRAEHWIVVRGCARVTVGSRTENVHENESIYVPMGAVHRLENPGRIPVELIEVQTGSYLGEDDIVRIEDDFQRV